VNKKNWIIIFVIVDALLNIPHTYLDKILPAANEWDNHTSLSTYTLSYLPF